jgi:SPW repeat
MDNWTNAKLCDVANLILGAFLFLSPWIFGFGGTAAGNANIAGIVMAALAIAALAAFAVWEEWLNLIRAMDPGLALALGLPCGSQSHDGLRHCRCLGGGPGCGRTVDHVAVSAASHGWPLSSTITALRPSRL